ncbi:MAG: hypothetical protein KBG02_13790 [Haliscomenobacter sp.]|nr:hypothetical protein [Haliscomenobacter sp.]MBP9874137.1 hypothetical protein [Haliscomenobacter sp.]
MAKRTGKITAPLQVEQNDHSGQNRLNTPPVGLVDENERMDSLPFEMGERRQVAVKVIDRRGVERIHILKL